MSNEIARRLRKTMTPQEVKLWVHLRSWRVRGFHFRRQAPRARHIVDFACLKHRLIVEIDGGQHNIGNHIVRDRARDQNLKKLGFRVLRFWNSDVDRNLDGVLFAIDEALRAPPPGGPAALPLQGRDKRLLIPPLKGRDCCLPPITRYNFPAGDIATDCLMRHILALAALLALASTAAHAAEWCGFIDKEHAPVRCGYSSLSQCEQSLGGKKDSYCMPNPGFAGRDNGKAKVASRVGG